MPSPRRFDRKQQYAPKEPSHDFVKIGETDRPLLAASPIAKDRDYQDSRQGDFEGEDLGSDIEEVSPRGLILPRKPVAIDPIIESRRFSVVMILIGTILQALMLGATFGFYFDKEAIFGNQMVRSIVVFTIIGLIVFLLATAVWIASAVVTTAKSSEGKTIALNPKIRGNRNTWGIILVCLGRDAPYFVINIIIATGSPGAFTEFYQGFVWIFHTVYFIFAFFLSWLAYARLFAKLIAGENIGTSDEANDEVIYKQKGHRYGRGDEEDDRGSSADGDRGIPLERVMANPSSRNYRNDSRYSGYHNNSSHNTSQKSWDDADQGYHLAGAGKRDLLTEYRRSKGLPPRLNRLSDYDENDAQHGVQSAAFQGNTSAQLASPSGASRWFSHRQPVNTQEFSPPRRSNTTANPNPAESTERALDLSSFVGGGATVVERDDSDSRNGRSPNNGRNQSSQVVARWVF